MLTRHHTQKNAIINTGGVIADLISIAALVVALIAILVAGLQLTQQLLTRGYTICKYDRITSGNFTNGGKRNWHWR